MYFFFKLVFYEFIILRLCSHVRVHLPLLYIYRFKSRRLSALFFFSWLDVFFTAEVSWVVCAYVWGIATIQSSSRTIAQLIESWLAMLLLTECDRTSTSNIYIYPFLDDLRDGDYGRRETGLENQRGSDPLEFQKIFWWNFFSLRETLRFY